MLYADKRALQTNLKVSLLAIRERELTFYTNNSLAIGTQAAMFAGFAFAGLTQPLPEETSVLRALFLVCNVSALGAGPPFTATFARLSPQLLPLSARRALSPRARAAPPSPRAHAPRSRLRPRAHSDGVDDAALDARAGPRAARTRRLDAHSCRRCAVWPPYHSLTLHS